MDKINGYFNYPLINGYGCGFNSIYTRGYPYPLLNQVNYINNLNTFPLPKQKSSVGSVIRYYMTIQICALHGYYVLLKRKENVCDELLFLIFR